MVEVEQKFLLTQMQRMGKRAMPSKVAMGALYTAHAGLMKDQLSKHFDMFAAEQRRDRTAFALLWPQMGEDLGMDNSGYYDHKIIILLEY